MRIIFTLVINRKKKVMKTKTKILKINSEGQLVEFNNILNRFEIVSRTFSWGDITKGYVRESKRNYKANNQ
jgi:hypothetical protein